jgi:hypothetical protein
VSGQTTTWFRQQRLRETFERIALPFSAFDVALTRRVPASNAAINQLDEAGAYGYARVRINLGDANWNLLNGVQMANAVPILFPRASGLGWGTLHGWALIAVGPDKVAAVGTLVQPLRCIGGIRPNLPVGSIVFGEHD